jgi:hypothetical protein
MVELRKYAKRIQDVLGVGYAPKKNSVDSIEESHWLSVVVSELNKLSLECARELEQETGKYPKYGSPGTQPLEEAPPTRLLALSLVINYWLGWVNNEKLMDAATPQPFKAWDRIQQAYLTGRELQSETKPYDLYFQSLTQYCKHSFLAHF